MGIEKRGKCSPEKKVPPPLEGPVFPPLDWGWYIYSWGIAPSPQDPPATVPRKSTKHTVFADPRCKKRRALGAASTLSLSHRGTGASVGSTGGGAGAPGAKEAEGEDGSVAGVAGPRKPHATVRHFVVRLFEVLFLPRLLVLN